MNKAEQAVLELREIDELAAQDSILHRLSPLSKLFVTVFYIAVTVSFPKYALTRLVWMVAVPGCGLSACRASDASVLSEAAHGAAARVRGRAFKSAV